MSIVDAKCPNCGAQLRVDNSQAALICQYCESAFVVEQAINNYNVTNNVTNSIQADQVTIVQQGGSSGFEIIAGKLLKYNGAATDVVIPEGVVDCHWNNAFGHCIDSITSVSIPTTFTNLEWLSQLSGNKLNAFVVPSNHPAFLSENGVLYNKDKTIILRFPSGKTDVQFVIPNSVVEIGSYAFSDCENLTSVIIPNTVVKIGEYAFWQCSSLTSIRIPASVSIIQRAAFCHCKSLVDVVFDGTPQMEDDLVFKYTPYGTKKGCYIATCVYGSYDCPQVWILRRYRDNALLKTWYGKLFVHTYYAISPSVVKLFGDKKTFHSFWKRKLDKITIKLYNRGYEDTPYQDL